MKTSVVLPVQDPTPLSPFKPHNLEENLEKAAKFGYDGVELGITDPNRLNAKEIEKLLKKFKLELSAITTGQAFEKEGISFTDPDPAKRKAAVIRIKSQIRFAAEFPYAQVIVGLIRGRGETKQALSWFGEGIEKSAAQAAEGEVKLVLEPLNRYETELVNTVEEALEFIENIKELGLLFDTFHANIEEPSLIESMKSAGGNLAYLHIADSNRWAPGFGHIDFRSIFKALREIRYEGFLSLEALPKPDPDICMEKTIDYLEELLGN